VVHQHGVAVRFRLGDLAGRERAAGTGNVGDDDLLAKRRAHRLGDQPRHRIRRAAGRERDHERDRSGGFPGGETRLGAG
jgi:hypothetical protein